MNQDTTQTQQPKRQYRFQDHIPRPSAAQLALIQSLLPDKPSEELDRMTPSDASRLISECLQLRLTFPPSKKQIQFLRWWGLWDPLHPWTSKQAHALIDVVKKKINGLSPEEASKQSESSRLAAKGDTAGIPILTREEMEGIVGWQTSAETK